TSIGDTHVSIIKEGSPDPITLEYKVGEGSWSSYTVDSEIILSDKQPVKFRAGNGGNPHFSKDDRNFYRVVVSGEGQINISGNIMSLLNGELLTNSLPDYCFRGLFSSCAALVDASTLILPATELSSHCYARMFGSCSNLISAPILPATTLADYCYYWMFRYCSALTSAPELPATTLAEHCYDTMFLGCSSLSSAPDLPATTLADNCYSTMFSGCTGLTSAPELHASTLADNCYSSMFSGCRNLVSAPELPASTLAKGCYQSMFSNCQSLVSAPELPAEILVDNCYSSMFLNCMYLKYIKMLATDVSAEGCLFNWVSQVYPSGTFVKSKEAIWDNFGECGIPPFWTVICDDGTPVKPEVDKPFTISSSGNTSLSISKIGSPEDVLLEYKKGNGDWEPYIIGSEIYINEYMSVQFRAGENGNTHFSQSLGDYYHLTTAGDGLIKATGNIMSLLDRDMHAESLSGYCFYNFFGQCSQLCDASTLSLPASTLAHYCYANMFDECSNLSFAPELPALTLAYMCYEKMFRKCTNLITAPKLPATTLASNCYKRMFMGCKGLINAPELPATSLAGACYCCMFVDCTNLVNAPVLPATTLEEVCYESMFLGCSNLQYIKMLATDISAQRCLENWVSEVSASGTFVKNAAATWSNEDVVPSGWTVITE
ncbi:MAG: leucine-rich repeat protein, partial [Clostridiales bacterium]|nr:leucine-rich repeat protein [Candidatus Crickella merdequi]